MRYIVFSILTMFIVSAKVYASDVDAQIDAIKNASIEERFKLMNAFKKNLIKMKEKERIDAIKKLSIKSNNKNAKMALDELKQHHKRNTLKKQLEHDYIDEDSFIDDQEGNDYD